MKANLKTAIFGKPKSDAEYIRSVRWSLRIGMSSGLLGLALGILFAIIGFGIPYWIYRVIYDETKVPLADAHLGIWFGWALGGVGGLFILMGVLQIGLALNSIKGHKTEKLLIKYYDMAMAGRAPVPPEDDGEQRPAQNLP